MRSSHTVQCVIICEAKFSHIWELSSFLILHRFIGLRCFCFQTVCLNSRLPKTTGMNHRGSLAQSCSALHHAFTTCLQCIPPSLCQSCLSKSHLRQRWFSTYCWCSEIRWKTEIKRTCDFEYNLLWHWLDFSLCLFQVSFICVRIFVACRRTEIRTDLPVRGKKLFEVNSSLFYCMNRTGIQITDCSEFKQLLTDALMCLFYTGWTTPVFPSLFTNLGHCKYGIIWAT